MKNNIRNWHTWLSISLGIPLILVGLTTFFIAHEKKLGTNSVTLPMSIYEENEIRTTATVGKETWLGTKQGIYRIDHNMANLIEGAPKDEIRSILSINNAVLLAGKKGLWFYDKGQSIQVTQADCWSLNVSAQGYQAVCKEGLMTSTDGQKWIKFPAIILPHLPAKEITLSKVIMDIHTGKLFFGKLGEWIWIDVLGAAIVVLGLTGLVMWLRNRRNRS